MMKAMTVTDWKVAMLLLVPFIRGHQKVWAWAVLMGASLSTYVVTGAVGYMAIDIVAAALILATKPSNLPQRLIGALFVGMLMFDLGFYLSPQANPEILRFNLVALGWLQWAVLAAWTFHDFRRNYRSRAGPSVSMAPSREGRI